MSNSLIEVKDLKVYFKQKSPKLLSFKPGILKAVDQVSFSIEKGKTFGLVGESGSGKSTIGKAILRYHKPTGGEIFYGGTEIGAMGEKELLPYRKKMQSVFQDPYSSLDPSHTVQDIICEPMEIHKLYTPKERKERAKELIRVVGLKEQDLLKYPHEFSGGQRQRISIARALSVQPEFVVCDEPISALPCRPRSFRCFRIFRKNTDLLTCLSAISCRWYRKSAMRSEFFIWEILWKSQMQTNSIPIRCIPIQKC